MGGKTAALVFLFALTLEFLTPSANAHLLLLLCFHSLFLFHLDTSTQPDWCYLNEDGELGLAYQGLKQVARFPSFASFAFSLFLLHQISHLRLFCVEQEGFTFIVYCKKYESAGSQIVVKKYLAYVSSKFNCADPLSVLVI